MTKEIKLWVLWGRKEGLYMLKVGVVGLGRGMSLLRTFALFEDAKVVEYRVRMEVIFVLET